MHFPPVLRSVGRLATSLAIVAAVAGQMQYLAQVELLRAVNFFSFFTIQSNVLACLVLLGMELAPDHPLGSFARWARGGMTLYMTMTGVIYAVLLAPIAADVSTQLDWVNAVVHIVAPAIVLVDWVTSPPEATPGPRTAALWLVFPVAWLAYTVLRGLVVDWYPYPFIDPRAGVENAAGSWGAVIVTTAILAIGVALLAAALRWIAATSPFGERAATPARPTLPPV